MKPNDFPSIDDPDQYRVYRFKIWMASKRIRRHMKQFIKLRKLHYQTNQSTPLSHWDQLVDWRSIKLPSLYDIIYAWDLPPSDFFAEIDPDYQLITFLHAYYDEFFATEKQNNTTASFAEKRS